MDFEKETMRLFAGTSHPKLAQRVADKLGISLAAVSITRHPDQEISVHISENVRSKDCYVLQSLVGDPNSLLVELLILVDALRRSSAKSVTAVLPYFAYARQDRRGSKRSGVAARLMADLLETAGVDRVISMDIHAEQVAGFFKVPFENLSAGSCFAAALGRDDKFSNFVVVSPDYGGVRRARAMADFLRAPLAIVDKRRLNPREVEIASLLGDVQGKNVLLVDDLCSTGKTLVGAAEICLNQGAKRVYAAVTHAVVTKESAAGLLACPIEKILVSDTTSLTEDLDKSKFEVVEAASVFAQAIFAQQTGASISSLV